MHTQFKSSKYKHLDSIKNAFREWPFVTQTTYRDLKYFLNLNVAFSHAYSSAKNAQFSFPNNTPKLNKIILYVL